MARITGRRGNTFSIDAPLMADCMVADHAKAATVFPVVSGSDIRGARVEDLVIEGNKEANPPLNGCRGAGIYLYRGFGTTIRGCVVRDYDGDGISFQQSNDVTVVDCVSEDNTDLGFHPGSGSQRPVLRDNARPAQRHGRPVPVLAGPPRRVRGQPPGGQRPVRHLDRPQGLRQPAARQPGRRATARTASSSATSPRGCRRTAIAWRATSSRTTAGSPGTAGIRIRGEPSGLIFEGNVIRDTREGSERTQTVGILVEDRVGPVEIGTNRIEAGTAVDDRRREGPRGRGLPSEVLQRPLGVPIADARSTAR